MNEVKEVRQITGEPKRRWFCGDKLDLIVWCVDGGAMSGFQLCYTDGQNKKALTWLEGQGYSHNEVDEGEDRPGGYKMTPILLRDGVFPRWRVLTLFEQEAKGLDVALAECIREKLEDYHIPTVRTIRRKKKK